MEHESIVSDGFCDFSYDPRLYVASMNTDAAAAAAAVAAGVLNVAVVVVVVVDPVVDASVYWYPPVNFLHLLLLILCV